MKKLKLFNLPAFFYSENISNRLNLKKMKLSTINIDQFQRLNNTFNKFMDNQKAVFNLCPGMIHSNLTPMQELQLDLNQDTIQTTVDICLHLTYFRNLTALKLGPLQIVISALSEGLALAVPYQIISNKTHLTTSKIDIETYSSSLYVLHPMENCMIDQLVIFKIHVPIDHVETGNLKVVMGLDTLNEMSFDNHDKTKRLCEVELNFNSILYIDSFLPCSFKSFGVSLEGNIYTHILGCKYANFNNIYRHHFYQAIDHLVICYNKLREKTNFLIRNIQNHGISAETVQDLPFYIEMKKYEEYEEIKGFIEKRIFQEQTMKEHRKVLEKFVQRFIPQMTEKLLIVWKVFLKLVNYKVGEEPRRQFEQKLGMELKKRMEYKVINENKKPINKNKKASSQIFRKQFPKQHQTSPTTTVTSSITRSQTSQIYSFTQNETAYNQLKETFDDKNIYTSLKKIHISNLQLPYPTVKVRLDKSLKDNPKGQMIVDVQQPHVIVLVHGLGATSTAFCQFEAMLKETYWKNMYVLNSVSNQKFVDEDMEQMGKRLAIELTQFVIQNNFGQKFQLSFIGHSLGGLIIRSALPRLQNYKFNMKTFITLSTPHLGYFYHNSHLNKAGMWALSKFSNNQIMNDLLMSDSHNTQLDQEASYRNSYLYLLSQNQGINWFEHVMFCGSQDDYFVSPLSAFATTRESIMGKKDVKARIWEEMRVSIEKNLTGCNVYRLLVQFGENSQTSIKDQLIGRAAHILYLSSQDFISYVLLVYKELFL